MLLELRGVQSQKSEHEFPRELDLPVNKKADILYTVAQTPDGVIVTANDGVKGVEYCCLNCNGPMVLRKSGSIAPGSKRPHFAHKSLSPNCSPETVLHFQFKNTAYEILSRKIANHEHQTIQWQCDFCRGQHFGDMLRRTEALHLESKVGPYQPDLALEDQYGDIYAVIEVVVTHKPEEDALYFYAKNSIRLIQYNLASDKDLAGIEGVLEKPVKVGFCPNPKCKKCGHHMYLKQLAILDIQCWRCQGPMKMALVVADASVNMSGTYRVGVGDKAFNSDFDSAQVQLAREIGVKFESESRGGWHVSGSHRSICSICTAPIGYRQAGDYLAQYFSGELPGQLIDSGYECSHFDCPSER